MPRAASPAMSGPSQPLVASKTTGVSGPGAIRPRGDRLGHAGDAVRPALGQAVKVEPGAA
jgi:hypothetical protein